MRTDIQCLRGIAIILVLLFHLFPKLFVNGFLGVDIFFVISGFLMAKNLTNRELKSFNDFLVFYYKRRILPLYYLVVFVTVVMVHLYLGDYLWENNNRYSLASLFLVTNQLVIHDQMDYFNEFLAKSSSVNAFLHLWSLSVEMQFYLIVPFIFYGLQLLKHNYLKLAAVSLIAEFGFIAFSLVVKPFAFNFMFLRLWQFSAGFAVLFWSKIEENLKKKQKKEEKNRSDFPKNDIFTVSLSIIALCFLPKEINALYLRPLVTLATACVIACDSQILSSRILSYIGDISYVMYLVHWPLIAMFSANGPVFGIVLILVSSITLHQLFEKKYLLMSWKSLVPLVFTLVMGNVCLQKSVRMDSFWNVTYSVDVQHLLIANRAQLPYSWKYEEKREECIEETPVESFADGKILGYGSCVPGNGTLSILVAGNSWAMNFRNPIRAQFNYNYSSFRYCSVSASYGLIAEDFWYSQKNLEALKQLVGRFKPDVLFLIAMHPYLLQSSFQENDKYLREINENINYYEKYAKTIYILGSHPLYPSNLLTSFLNAIVDHKDDIEDLHLNRREADRQMRNVKKRFNMVKCTRCHFFDLSHVFMEDDKYLTFDRDRMIGYVDNSAHLTGAGMKMCEPVLKRVAEEIMKKSEV
ncbi:hypothetical protein GCK72_021787 [Caenorhabditis remanei]|uniref:Acyl_transf_3 domain-containing protein n=1 Tax=Caenorhabditis remanei TaxID=31234 RepID=A0A6A5GJ34_CAERE|nr:hypothetical protein GCK72_021787 [Caenorhabditis remanei]KAF1755218.1 hypothetical protein GCK72_021787 [Caenorhabditis remanei]